MRVEVEVEAGAGASTLSSEEHELITLNETLAFARAYADSEEAMARAYSAAAIDSDAAKALYRSFHDLHAAGVMTEWAGVTAGNGTAEHRAAQSARIQKRHVFRVERFDTEAHGSQVAATLGEAQANDFGFEAYNRLIWVARLDGGPIQVVGWSPRCPHCGASGFFKGKPPTICAECAGIGWNHPRDGERRGIPLRPTTRTEDLKVHPPTYPRNMLSWNE